MGDVAESGKRNRDYRPDRPIVAEIAAGGVVQHPSEPCILLLHEEGEDRWCLPKGHVDAGESLSVCALREVREETALQGVEIIEELGEITYRFYDPSKDLNVFKIVFYYLMRSPHAGLPEGPIRDHAQTFDRLEWVSLTEAKVRVPYPTDLEVLRRAGPRLERP
ncbi:MAG: NUDIX domain-containing protein [Euryarchaeota archaeon]|nr:NUDIX domain-containing protein [Euryarchaeota archaeon]MDE2044330.1 NUDIX domain-containing protein [Thermoplasmata archaeon]